MEGNVLTIMSSLHQTSVHGRQALRRIAAMQVIRSTKIAEASKKPYRYKATDKHAQVFLTHCPDCSLEALPCDWKCMACGSVFP